jgi:hypothetical protein
MQQCFKNLQNAAGFYNWLPPPPTVGHLRGGAPNDGTGRPCFSRHAMICPSWAGEPCPRMARWFGARCKVALAPVLSVPAVVRVRVGCKHRVVHQCALERHVTQFLCTAVSELHTPPASRSHALLAETTATHSNARTERFGDVSGGGGAEACGLYRRRRPVFDRAFVMGWICYITRMLMLIDSCALLGVLPACSAPPSPQTIPLNHAQTRLHTAVNNPCSTSRRSLLCDTSRTSCSSPASHRQL